MISHPFPPDQWAPPASLVYTINSTYINSTYRWRCLRGVFSPPCPNMTWYGGVQSIVSPMLVSQQLFTSLLSLLIIIISLTKYIIYIILYLCYIELLYIPIPIQFSFSSYNIIFFLFAPTRVISPLRGIIERHIAGQFCFLLNCSHVDNILLQMLYNPSSIT